LGARLLKFWKSDGVFIGITFGFWFRLVSAIRNSFIVEKKDELNQEIT
jgi:hypothetical protein